MGTVEVRCPANPRKLLMKLRLDGERPAVVNNLIEMACDDCKRYWRRHGDPEVSLVLHRFDLAGELVESETRH